MALITKKSNSEINCIQVDNRSTKEPTKIANEFYDHLTTVVKKIEQKLIKPKFNFFKHLKNPNEQSFFINPTNAEEVLYEIKNLKCSKSTGPCSIPLKLLKLFQKVLSKPIVMIANISFSSRTFPTTLKTANVIPIFKKDDHTICNTIDRSLSCLILK